MRPAKFAIAAAPLGAILFAAPAWASPASHITTIGSCRANGDYAVCAASGSVNYPLALRVHVNSGPRQQVSVYWTVTCAKGYGAGSKSGHFTGRTPVNRGITMNYRRPDNCVAAADAQLSSGGTLHVWITARK